MRALAEAAKAADWSYESAIVASDKPEAPGLGWARAEGIQTFALSPKGIGKRAYEAQIDAALRTAGVEVIALAGYMRLLSDDFVARWRGRIINIHPGSEEHTSELQSLMRISYAVFCLKKKT